MELSHRKLEDGDIVNVDVTVYYKGVHGEHLILLTFYMSLSLLAVLDK